MNKLGTIPGYYRVSRNMSKISAHLFKESTAETVMVLFKKLIVAVVQEKEFQGQTTLPTAIKCKAYD